jgi:hypothetical protein
LRDAGASVGVGQMLEELESTVERLDAPRLPSGKPPWRRGVRYDRSGSWLLSLHARKDNIQAPE